MRESIFFFCCLIFLPILLSGQRVIRTFDNADIDSLELYLLKKQYGCYKTIPEKFEKPILVALSYYPELAEIKIIFREKKKNSPLMAKPGFFSAIFKQPHKRTYYIIISSDPEKYLKHIKFSSLPFNAQIGVVGHELTHVVDFTQRDLWGIGRIALGNLSNKWLDKFEFNTDRKTIDHGLGYQLLDWSLAVRKRLNIVLEDEPYDLSEEQIKEFEESSSERYMNPSTISNIIESHPLYIQFYGEAEE